MGGVMRDLPDNVTFYSRTPVYTEKTLPPGFLKNHRTKEGVWGVIEVVDGELEYVIGTSEKHILRSGYNGVVEPQVLHHVKPLGEVSFSVAFYR
tara:strand:+ start:1443 stop:1724 length:282 start_codon:yes stop_codon:yes gene_type:complete